MSAELRIFREVRAQMLQKMDDFYNAGDHDSADYMHGLLERQHTRRWTRVGGSLSAWDVLVLGVLDLCGQLTERRTAA